MFGITSALQFYQKLIQEFDDCCEHPGSARHAMNFVITAYHLHEWVWKGFLKNDDAKRVELGIAKKMDAFKEWLDRNIWYAQIQSLANGSKHFQAGDLQFITHHIGPSNTFAPNELAFNDGYSVLLVEMGEFEGRPHMIPASHLFEVVMRFWRDFFRHHSPIQSYRRAGPCFPMSSLLGSLNHLDLGFSVAQACRVFHRRRNCATLAKLIS